MNDNVLVVVSELAISRGKRKWILNSVEKKKSYQADLEHQRITNFLLGLVFVLALLYVSFEYTSAPTSDEHNNETTDDMSQDIELMPAMDTRDMISIASGSASHAVTEKLKAVDGNPKLGDKISPNNGDMTQGGGGENVRTNTQDEPNTTTAQSQVAVDENDNPLHFRIVEKLPEFPGGMVEFMKWLTKNLHYPVLAQKQRLEGKVVVSFIINKDGSITNEKVERSVDPLLDQEALRVVRMMPKWKPGIDKNKPCRTLFAIPINFKL